MYAIIASSCESKVINSTMDILYIRNLKVDAVVGIFSWEKRIRQPLHLDLEIALDIRQAAATDNIAYALDYKTVSMRLTQYISQSEWHLIETLAEKIAALLMEEFGVTWLRLRLSKPAALPTADSVGLLIERGSLQLRPLFG
jgi:dihydroneopterin aldolase